MRSIRAAVAVVLVMPIVIGCGRERASGTGAVDTTTRAGLDTTSARTGDTAPVAVPESATAGTRDTTPAPQPPSARPAQAQKPAAPKPRKPSASARQPSSDTTSAKDTTNSAAAAPKPDSQVAAAPQGAGAPLRDAYHQAPLDTVSQVVYDGWKQFNLNCARCHGEDVQGTTIAPHLIVSLRPEGPINTKELFVQTVCAGRPAKGMPAWCSLGLGMDKINSIYAYVKGRSDGKIHPGRPAVQAGG
ncbi:MAG TPA: c-type cytochrome [Gemmatimonadales bacterium]|nr:c-type cytochrome [Gemmatimonadales bacterium]